MAENEEQVRRAAVEDADARANAVAAGVRPRGRRVHLDVANIQVLIARYGDRVPHMLSGERSIEEQLEQLARDHGEKHITVNGEPYAAFAEEYVLERRGDAEHPELAGRGSIVRHDPDEALERNREAGIHNPEDRQRQTIVPVATIDPTGHLADEARRRKEEQAQLDRALEDDERRKRERGDTDAAARNQLSKQLAEQAGLGTGGQGSGPDMRDAADRQEEKSDAELEQLIRDAEGRGDTESVDEIRRYQAMTNEERRQNRPIVEPDGRVRVATRDPNELANEPPPPPRPERLRADLAADPVNSRSKPPIEGVTDEPERPRDVILMSDDELREELRRHGNGLDAAADRDTLEQLVSEERAKRLPK